MNYLGAHSEYNRMILQDITSDKPVDPKIQIGNSAKRKACKFSSKTVKMNHTTGNYFLKNSLTTYYPPTSISATQLGRSLKDSIQSFACISCPSNPDTRPVHFTILIILSDLCVYSTTFVNTSRPSLLNLSFIPVVSNS
jgi:hypothetical protein